MSTLYQPTAAAPAAVVPPDAVFSTSYGDPNARANRQEAVHNWVPWIGGYSASFARSCIREFGGDGLVYDPFAGVGTTLLGAVECGRNAVGVELNPYASLSAAAKCSVPKLDLDRVAQIAIHVRELSSEKRSLRPYPEGFGTRRPFFSESVWAKVGTFLDYLGHDSSLEADLMRLAFGACMVSFSNYSYEPSLSSRIGAKKPEILDADVFGTVSAKIQSMLTGAKDWMALFQSSAAQAAVSVGNSLTVVPISGRRVSLVLTSPPYLNNYHYVRNTRPQLYFLGLVNAADGTHSLRTENFGSYWQEMRNAPDPEPRFSSPQIRFAISRLRSVDRKSGAYSGNGWARYATRYFNDTVTLLETLLGFLPRGAHIVLVLGNSVIQGVNFAVDRLIADIATELGFRVEGIAMIRRREQGNKLLASSVRAVNCQAVLYESMVVLKKR